MRREQTPNSKRQSDAIKRESKRVRLSVQCGGVLRFFDLPIKRVTEPQLHHAIDQASLAFVSTFKSVVKEKITGNGAGK